MDDNPLFHVLHSWLKHARYMEKKRNEASRYQYKPNKKRKGQYEQAALAHGWRAIYDEALQSLGSAFLEYMSWYDLEAKDKKPSKKKKIGKNKKK